MTTQRIAHQAHTHVRPSFSSFALGGLLAGITLAGALASSQALPLAPLVAAVAAALAGVYAQIVLAQVLTQRRQLVFLRAALAGMLVGTIVLSLLAPVIPYLDCSAPGLALGQAIGRLGCLRAGCCHGRPSRHGLRYDAAAPGCPTCYRHLTLAPVQLLEAAWLGVVALAGVWLVFQAAPGSALLCYLTASMLGRFWIEFLRGDGGRTFWLGISEGQWIALGLLAGAALVAPSVPAARFGCLIALATVGSATLYVAITAARGALRPLHTPYALQELAAMLRSLLRTAPTTNLQHQTLRLHCGLDVVVERSAQGEQITIIGRIVALRSAEVRRIGQLAAQLAGDHAKIVLNTATPGGACVLQRKEQPRC